MRVIVIGVHKDRVELVFLALLAIRFIFPRVGRDKRDALAIRSPSKIGNRGFFRSQLFRFAAIRPYGPDLFTVFRVTRTAIRQKRDARSIGRPLRSGFALLARR